MCKKVLLSSSLLLQLVLLFILVIIGDSSTLFGGTKCGHEICPKIKSGMLNVHVICHSHLDTGWVKTYDEYYYSSVRDIISSVTHHLAKSPDRRFIMVETSYFSRWWSEQANTVREEVRKLIKSGQLEFISGGWSMNDEACPRYQTIIDQLTFGHKWLNDTFGQCAIPKIGWQIDPFGHSREYASILSQMGFDALFLGRIDYQDKAERIRNLSLEFVWKSSPSIGDKNDLFTGVLPNVYWPPETFCFDRYCFNEQIHDGNVHRRAKAFINMIKAQSANYATHNTLVTMGLDFQWQDAAKWYYNLDPLMRQINALQSTDKVNIFYSTPSCYLKSLYASDKEWPVKMDDFMPYADAFNTYWSGYFTSRPSLKLHIRYANNFLQAAKQLTTLVTSRYNYAPYYRALQQALGINMHHDAITGTCQQHVDEDYTLMLADGIHKAEKAVVYAMNNLIYPIDPRSPASSPINNFSSVVSSQYANYYASLNSQYLRITSKEMYFCHAINISECDIVQKMGNSEKISLHIYNPVANPVKSYIRLPIFGTHYSVFNSESTRIVTQVAELAGAIQNLPKRAYNSSLELIFRAQLPPLGYSTYVIQKHSEPGLFQRALQETEMASDVMIKNGKFVVVIDAQTGLIKEIVLSRNRRVKFKQNFHIYHGETNYGEKPSGAYAFNPSNNGSNPAANKVSYKVVRGPLVEEIHQVYNSWITQVIRVYQHVDYIEFDWVVGPIPIDRYRPDSGKEIVSVFDTELLSNKTFFTDSNGRETIRRVRDHRYTWKLETTEKYASNYYPVTSWMFIRDYDKNLQLTVMPDRCQGGSSLKDGRLEMMVHRRLLRDDGFGVEQPLNEPGEDHRGLIARGRHYVIVDDIRTSVQKMRILSKSFANKPILVFEKKQQQDSNSGGSDFYERTEFTGLNRKLPLNINLLTLERWDDNRALIRLEHIFEINEDPKYSRPRRVSLRDLFSPKRVVSAVEMTLNALEEKKAFVERQLRWKLKSDPYSNYTNKLPSIDRTESSENANSGGSSSALVVYLYPMEIKTFLITFEKK